MDRRSEIREEIKSLKDTIATKNAENEQIVNSVKGTGEEGSPLEIEPGMQAAYTANRKEIDEARDRLVALYETEETKGFLDRIEALGDPRGSSAGVQAAALAAQMGGRPAVKDLGESFVASDAFRAMIESGKASMDLPFRVEGGLSPFFLKDLYSDLPTGTPGSFGSIQRDPMVPQAMRSVRVRDLFPAQRTTAALIEYFRVTGFTNNASVVPERDSNQSSGFGRKPQSSLTFAGEQAAVRTIAHWEAAHRNVLADEPALAGLVNTELLYGLRLVEDDQILNGTGSGQDLLGIRNVTGIQTYAWSSGATTPVKDNKADAVRRAMTLALLAYYEPTGVVCHDGDWEDMELLKDNNGQYLLATSIAVGGEQRIWRSRVVTTPAIDEGYALVGSFGLGAQIYDREDASVRISEHHANFFVENAVAVLAEERLALATKRPESFVEVHFDAAPA